MELRRGFRISSYIFFEIIPSLLLGLAIFLGVILMFQVLRLTEFTLVHGGSIATTAEVIFYICISLLPALFPMSLLFSILMTYSRLSQESEIVAMKASGLSMISLFAPGVFVGLIMTMISAQTSFYIAPWGNRQFELLYTEIAHTKAAAIIKPGTFSEGFFDLVVYAQDVNSKTGELQNVFIYDEKQSQSPMTIIARRGRIMTDPLAPGHNALLRLEEGDIHRSGETHTKIRFESYDVRLVEPLQFEERKMTPGSMTLDDLRTALDQRDKLEKDQILSFDTELNKRWSVATLCLLFSIVAMGLGIQTNRRSQKSNSMILCIGIIVIYYGLFVTLEGMSRSGNVPALAVWFPHLLFSGFGFWKVYQNWD